MHSRVDHMDGAEVFRLDDTMPRHVRQGDVRRDGPGRRRWWYASHGGRAKDGVCCKCCTDAGGCGILNADWLDAATFRGEDTVRIDRGHSVKALKFEVDGLQSNYFWRRPDSDTPVRLLQSPNDDMLFSQDDFARGPVDDKVFELPPGCGERRCGGICSRLD